MILKKNNSKTNKQTVHISKTTKMKEKKNNSNKIN